MNTLDLWKHVEKLSVDEFMCLLFELEPGTVQFDYGNPKDWPKDADRIYKNLTEALQAKKLRVFFDDIGGDPFYNGAYDRFYAGSDNPWWAACGDINCVGKIHRRELVKWLAKNEIPSDHFGVPHAPSKPIKQEISADPIEQTPTQQTVTEEKPMQAKEANSPLLRNFDEVINVDPLKITPQLVANNYLLIGVLLEFLVGERKGVTFKNQSELVQHIHDEYYKFGVKGVAERTVHNKFGIANTLNLMLDKARNQLGEALDDARS